MAAEPAEPRMIADRYRLEKVIGEGAVGSVWLAEHVLMRKHFALKLLDAAIASPEIVARFEREAVAAANLTHPNIVGATDFGRLDDGSFFLVLEYVRGRTLRKVIEEGPMAPRRALAIVRQVLLALQAAHDKGVIHRDIKPENVMLIARDDGSELAKVLDFGIAKVDVAGELANADGAVLTKAGMVYGTPIYMPPEQALGEIIDARADLYAAGVILYELVAGEPPFDGEGVVVITKQINEDAPPLSSKMGHGAISSALDAFAAKMLARERDDRPASAAEAIKLLDAADKSYAKRGDVAPVPVTPPAPRAKPRPASNEPAMQIGSVLIPIRLLIYAVAALAVVVLIVVLLTGDKPRDEDARDDPATNGPKPSLSNLAPPEEPSTSAAPSAPPSAPPSASASVVAPKAQPLKKQDKSLGAKLKSLFK